MMAIPKEIKNYVSAQIQYYIDESETYRDIAQRHGNDNVVERAFGVILGCLYLGFIQAYRTQFVTPSSEDVDEFHQMMRVSESRIRNALQDSDSAI